MTEPNERPESPNVAGELPLDDYVVPPNPVWPPWVSRVLLTVTVVIFGLWLALYWTVGDDWEWRCGPDHPWFEPHFSSCPQPPPPL